MTHDDFKEQQALEYAAQDALLAADTEYSDWLDELEDDVETPGSRHLKSLKSQIDELIRHQEALASKLAEADKLLASHLSEHRRNDLETRGKSYAEASE